MLPDIQKLSERRLVLGLALLSGVLIFWNLGGAALIDWDESIYAAVAREMAEGGDWLTLHWNRETFFEKPPLYFWLTAGMFKIFGVSEFAARFWSALAGVLGTCVVYLFGKKLFGRVAGILAGLVLATTIHWVFQSRNGMLDVFAATLILLTLYFFWLGWERGGRLRHWGLFGACAGWFFWLKGRWSLSLFLLLLFLRWRISPLVVSPVVIPSFSKVGLLPPFLFWWSLCRGTF